MEGTLSYEHWNWYQTQIPRAPVVYKHSTPVYNTQHTRSLKHSHLPYYWLHSVCSSTTTHLGCSVSWEGTPSVFLPDLLNLTFCVFMIIFHVIGVSCSGFVLIALIDYNSWLLRAANDDTDLYKNTHNTEQKMHLNPEYCRPHYICRPSLNKAKA